MNRQTLMAVASFWLLGGSLSAATYYWDNNGATAGFGTAAGTWATATTGSATLGWSTDATGATLPSGSITTATTDTINFGNTSTGLAAGTVTVSGTVGAGNITFASGSGAIVLSGGTISMAAAETITVNNATDTINSVLTGAATSFTKAGTGILVLGGVNTYTGATTLTAGTLSVAASTNLGAASAGLVFNGGTLQITGTALTNFSGIGHAVTFTAAKLVSLDINAAANTFTVDQVLNQTTGGFTKAGTGTVILNQANTYTGNTTLTAGTLSVSTSANLGGAGAAFVFNGGTLQITGTALTSISSFGHAVTFTATKLVGLDIADPSNVFTVDQVLNQTTGGFTKAGAGTVILNQLNTYTGVTTVNAGVLQAGSATAFGPATNASLVFGASSTGKVQLFGNSITVIGLTSNATVGSPVLESGSGTVGIDTLTINNASNNTFAGVLQDGSARQLALVKGATGVLTLSGANTYTGGTSVTSGTLTFLNTGAQPATGTTTVAAGATLGLGVATTGAFYTTANIDSLFAGALANVTNDPASNVGIDTSAGDFTYATSISSSRGLVKLGANILTLTGTNTYTGNTTIVGGTLQFANLLAMPSTSTVAVQTGTTIAVNAGGAGEFTNGTSGNGTIGGLIAGLGAQSPSTVAYTGAVGLGIDTTNAGGSLTYAGVIANVGTTLGVTKLGTGTLFLTAANTFTGSLNVAAGTVQIGDGATSGSIASTAPISVGANGTLTFDRTDTVVMSNVFSGTGNIIKNGTGTINQQSNSSGFTGSLTINAGTFIVSGLTTGTFNFNPVSIVVNAGTFQFGQGGVSGENPNLPDTTYITLNTGTTYISNVGEQFGGINLQGGTITIGVASADITGFGTSAASWTSGTFNGLAATYGGTAAINKTTSGTVLITGSASLAGTAALNIIDGTMAYAADANFTATRPITMGGATAGSTIGAIEYQGATPAAAKAQAITLNPGGGIVRVNTTATNLTLSGVIGGTGALTKSGTGILTLTGTTNSYSGGTNLTSGSLSIAAGNGLGTGALTVGTGALSYATVSLAVAGTGFLTVANNAATTFANDIGLPTPGASPVLMLVKNTASSTTGTNLLLGGTISGGGSTTILVLNSNTSGDSTTTYEFFGTNTFSGTVRINRGGIVLDNASSIGNATLEVLSNANATLTTGGNVRFNSTFTFANNIAFITTAGQTISSMANNPIVSGVISGTVTWGKVGTGTLILTGTNTESGVFSILEGTVQVGNNTTTGVTGTGNVTNNAALVFNRSNSITYAGVISGPGTVAQINPTGTLILTGTNTFTGGTTIASGTLQIGAGGTAGVLPGNVVNNGTLAFNRSDAINFAGNISGTGGVTNMAANTTTLTGTLSFSGAVAVNAGVLKITPFGPTSGTTVAGGSGLTIVNGAVPATYSTQTLNLGATGTTLRFDMNSDNPTAPLINVLTADGFNTNAGTHSIAFTNSATFSVGQFKIIQYAVTNNPSITSGFTLGTLPGRTAGVLAYTANSIDLNVTGADTITYTGAIDNTWDVGTAVDVGGTMNFKVVGLGPNNGNPTNFIQSDAVRFDDTASGPVTPFIVNLTTAVQPLTVTVDNTTNAYTFQGTGSIAGTGTLIKLGTNTLTLLTNNTYSGLTTVTAGTLQIGDGGVVGSIGTGTLVNNAAVVVNRSDDLSIANSISGTGALTKLGANNLTLTGAYTATGNTIISGGVLTFSNTVNYTYGGSISGTGALVKLGTGTVAIAGDVTQTGGTTITTGTLQIGTGGTTGTLPLDVTDNGTLAFSRSDTYTYSNVVSGTGALSKLGTGTVILTNANTYSGATTVSAGILQLGNGGTTGSIAGAVNGSGILAFNRSDDFTFGNSMTGALGLSKLGTNTVTLTGTNAQTGTATISAGTLSIGLATNLSAAPVAFDGGTLRATADMTLTPAFTVNANGGTIRVDPGFVFIKTTNGVGGSNSTLNIAGGGTFALQTSGGSTVTNVNVQNGIYRHTSVRYTVANTTPYTITIQPGSTLSNFDTISFLTTNYFPYGNLTGVTGSNITLNGDGSTINPQTTMFGAYVHVLDEASTTASNSATSNINVPVILASTSRFTLVPTGGTIANRAATDRIVDSLIAGVSGPGGLIVDGDGFGTLAITTVAATYAGPTRVANGTLRIGMTNALPTGTTLTLGGTTGDNVPDSSGTLELNAFGQTVAGLTTLGNGTNNRIGNNPSADGALTVNYNGANPQTFSGLIGYTSGTNFRNLTLTKDGTGTLILTGVNLLSRAVSVIKGTLALSGSGSMALAPTITVGSAGTFDVSAVTGGTNFSGTAFTLVSPQVLQGTGTVVGAVMVATGSVIRGDVSTGTGTLTTSNVKVASGGAIIANIAASGTNNRIALGTNTLDLTTGSKVTLVGISGFNGNQQASYTLASTIGGNLTLDAGPSPVADGFVYGSLTVGSPQTGPVTLDTATFGSTLNTGDQFVLSRSGDNLVLNFTPSVVPEPVTILGIASGLLLVGQLRRRRP